MIKLTLEIKYRYFFINYDLVKHFKAWRYIWNWSYISCYDFCCVCWYLVLDKNKIIINL